jgi:hypothetical protein
MIGKSSSRPAEHGQRSHKDCVWPSLSTALPQKSDGDLMQHGPDLTKARLINQNHTCGERIYPLAADKSFITVS